MKSSRANLLTHFKSSTCERFPSKACSEINLNQMLKRYIHNEVYYNNERLKSFRTKRTSFQAMISIFYRCDSKPSECLSNQFHLSCFYMISINFLPNFHHAIRLLLSNHVFHFKAPVKTTNELPQNMQMLCSLVEKLALRDCGVAGD